MTIIIHRHCFVLIIIDLIKNAKSPLAKKAK